MSDTNTVTIITPTYRRDLAVVARCIRSVASQTHQNWTHLICSDGEYEPDVAALVEQSGRRHVYLTTKQHYGDYGASVRNYVLETVDSDFACFVDDDNVILPQYLELMLAALSEPEYGFAICQCLHFGPLSPELGESPTILTGLPPRIGTIDTIQVLCRTPLIRASGWDCTNGYLSDGLTFSRMAQQATYVAVNELLALHF